MILYRPTDGDVHSTTVDYRPRTCFLMTQLGEPVSNIVTQIREDLVSRLTRREIGVIDAESEISGRDFLLKIWKLLIGVPLGIAIIHREMSQETFANIFYEVGLMHACGKEVLIVKTKGTSVPSDFVRTEYLEYGNRFHEKLDKFVDSFLAQADYFERMADQLERNPLLAIDYLRRAFLVSGNATLREKSSIILESAALQDRARNSVELLLADF